MSNQRVYIGIDPGTKGFIAVNNGQDVEFLSINDNDFYAISDFLTNIKEKYNNVVCIMEEVHAIFGASAKSTFSFGEINGVLKGLLMANKIPYHLVQPKNWQKEMWDNKDMDASYTIQMRNGKEISKKVVNTKQTSINAAKRLFPTIDLRKTTKCKNIDDNKCDSLLLSEYGRRKNL